MITFLSGTKILGLNILMLKSKFILLEFFHVRSKEQSYFLLLLMLGIFNWSKNMDWKFLNLVLNPIMGWHGRWQRGEVIGKSTSMHLFLPIIRASCTLKIFLDINAAQLVLTYPFYQIIRETKEKPGWCSDKRLPPCAAYVLYHISRNWFPTTPHVCLVYFICFFVLGFLLPIFIST